MIGTRSRSTCDALSSRNPARAHGDRIVRRSRAGLRRTAAALVTLAAVALLWPGAGSGRSPRSVVGTAHDLSAGGPLLDRATGEQRVCIFCHVTHSASRDGPLWSRDIPSRAYVVYTSSTLQARPDQPDGDSKLCLSCHDGTLAVGLIRSGAGATGMGAGHELTSGGFIAPGRPAHLGWDLSDDHPISFVYDAALAVRQGELAAPELTASGLGGSIRSDLLDAGSKVQCTTCHDAHDDSKGRFLRTTERGGQLCRVCHRQRDYDLSAHMAAQSAQFEENCVACHVDHGGAHPSTLLAEPQTDLCGRCHPTQGNAMRSGATTRHDLQDIAPDAGRRLTCATCHEPHSVRPSLLVDRQFVSDPDDPLRPRPLVSPAQTPHGYRTQPEQAALDGSDFCMDCHDGTWPGALDIATELISSSSLQTNFVKGRESLHRKHANRSRSSDAVGCTYCHDVHGTTGNRGVPRGRLLYEWITVREFPYRGESSCSTADVLGRCHDSH